MTIKTILTTLIVFLFITTLVTAEIPQVINYQGKLTESGGTPSDGAYPIRFIIYDASTGGNELWNSNIQMITVSNGLFEVMLGASPMPTLPDNLFSSDTSRYLGITVGNDQEIVPRIRFTSVACAYQSLRSDSAGYAATANAANTATVATSVVADAIGSSEIANGSITSTDIDNTSVQQRVNQSAASGYYITGINADGSVVTAPDQGGTGDITAVYTGSGLTGGGTSGAVTLYVPTGGITTTHISDNTIHNNDIKSTASISPSKIAGTAVNLSSTQTITGSKTFDGWCNFGDSTMRVNNNGISIGSANNPSSSRLITMQRFYNTTSTRYGLSVYLDNNSTTTGTVWGIYSGAYNAIENTSNRYGIQGTAGYSVNHNTDGNSYGVKGTAYGGVYAYGVYGYAGGASYFNFGGYFTQKKSGGDGRSYAGYFVGDVEATGFSSAGSGGFKIDHPLDPTNKYLYHSNVESPDMMNIYNGNVTTDANGYAEVTMPDYFEALNNDFRYQLTVIGDFAQAIIAQEIINNSFVIRTDKPNIKVSWMVTGIRKDAYAETFRMSPNADKPAHEVGLYLHPEAYGLDFDQSIHYEAHHQAELDDAEREAQDASER